jgi:regulator of sirC expression with transglutaminase-like and TPR domain
MNQPSSAASLAKPSASQREALIKLLTDDDPAIQETVRNTILSFGPEAAEWLRPHLLSSDPELRRRAREIVRQFERQNTDIRFLAFCLKHGEEFDLEEGAWRFAATEYPEVNIEAYQAVLDQYAAELRERIDPQDRSSRVLDVINEHLFGELGFTGNEKDYYDPQNSYLNRVLDRRTGNPINLSLLYLLLARRLRLPMTGIGLPGHFICRYQSTSDEIFVDVFNQGKLLTKADCVQFLVQGRHSLRDDFLAPVSPRRMLMRICANLHQIYLQLGRSEAATRIQRYLIALAK